MVVHLNDILLHAARAAAVALLNSHAHPDAVDSLGLPHELNARPRRRQHMERHRGEVASTIAGQQFPGSQIHHLLSFPNRST